MNRIPVWLRQAVAAALVALTVALYLAWEISHRGIYRYATNLYPVDDADEWRYTACSRLVLHGYRLFSQVFSAQPPLLFVSLASSMRLSGQTIEGARTVEIAFGVLALVASVWLAWQLSGPLGAVATGVLLAASPTFLVYSHAIEGEIPMMALVTLGLCFCVLYRQGPWVGFAILGGLALAAAVLMKLFALEAVIPALWVLCSRFRKRHIALFVVALLLPIVLEFALFAPSDQWEQVVALHQKVNLSALHGLIPAKRIITQFLVLDLGLTLLALAGLVLLLMLKRWFELGLLGSWLVGQLAMLLLFRPLFPHHTAILLSSLAVTAGVGVGLAIRQLGHGWQPLVLPVLIAAVAYIGLLPTLVHDDRHFLVAGLDPRVRSLSNYVRLHSGPRDFIVTDDLGVADTASRLVPPALCDPSNVRLHAGGLSAHTLIKNTENYRSTLVLPSFGIYDQVPGYIKWLKTHYRPSLAAPGQPVFLRR